MTRTVFQTRVLLGLCLLIAGGDRAQAPAHRPSQAHAYLFPTVRVGCYNLCLARDWQEKETLTPRLPELRAEFRNQGTLQTTAAKVTLLPAPLPVPNYGPLNRVPGRAWFGLRWDMSGLPPGLYTLTASVPVDALDSAGQPVSVPAKTASLPIYLPDPNGLKTAQAAFVGRRVWPRAGLSWAGTNSGAFEFDTAFSVRVRSITRLRQSYADLAMNGGTGPGWDLSSADFVTHDPLRVTFDKPRRLHVVGLLQTGTQPPALPAAWTQDFADPWQMERALRFRPLPTRLPTLRPGVSSPEQVLAAYGWPTDYGSLAQLRTRSEWRYAELKPFYATVFFKHGKFFRFDLGGHLP